MGRPASSRSGRRLTEHPADAPLRAWRYWLVGPTGRLGSVSQRAIGWPPGRTMTAVCLGGGHRPPDPGCACGLYGSRDLGALRDHGLCVVPSVLAVGEVDLWGRTVADDDGIRAQYARPASLALVPETAEVGRAPLDRLLTALADYGVPVSTMPLDQAVTGITAAMLQNQLLASRSGRPAAD